MKRGQQQASDAARQYDGSSKDRQLSGIHVTSYYKLADTIYRRIALTQRR